MEYKLEKKLAEDLFILSHPEHGTKMWSLCRLRKRHTCTLSRVVIEKGEKAFRPITNGYDRMNRISVLAMNNL